MPAKRIKEEGEEVSYKSSFDFVKVILVLLLLAAIGGLVWTYLSYNKAQKKIDYLSDPSLHQEVLQQETEELIKKVGKHIMLPEGQPMVATIEDAEGLAAAQVFFKGSSNGDKVLVYSDRAIIFNEEKDLIVNVGPVFTEEGTESTTEEGTESVEENVIEENVQMPLSLEIRNGSAVSGLAKIKAEELSSDERYNVFKYTNAINNEYESNIVVNLMGKDVSSLENEFGVTSINYLPEGEASSNADVLIILGNQ